MNIQQAKTERILIKLDPPPEFDPYTRGPRLYMTRLPAFMYSPEFAQKTQEFINALKEKQ